MFFMRIHYLQHAPFEGPAHCAVVARDRGARLSGTKLYAGEPLPPLEKFDLLAILGGPMGVYDNDAHPWLAAEKRFIQASIQAEKRIIGICLGAQLLADVMGARVYNNNCREIGWFPVIRRDEAAASVIGQTLPDEFYAFHWHGDTFDVPKGAIRIAQSAACENQGFVWKDRIVALQFHLEATHESVSNLLDNCRYELDGSEFVQTENEILNTNHILDSNRLFDRILAELSVKITGSE
jgi:GMP synthase-like glutamine amidotransferase